MNAKVEIPAWGVAKAPVANQASAEKPMRPIATHHRKS
jgi:hypothetical protein